LFRQAPTIRAQRQEKVARPGRAPAPWRPQDPPGRAGQGRAGRGHITQSRAKSTRWTGRTTRSATRSAS